MNVKHYRALKQIWRCKKSQLIRIFEIVILSKAPREKGQWRINSKQQNIISFGIVYVDQNGSESKTGNLVLIMTSIKEGTRSDAKSVPLRAVSKGNPNDKIITEYFGILCHHYVIA